MSVLYQAAVGAGRAALVSGVCLAIGRGLAPLLGGQRRGWRGALFWVLFLAPLLVPSVLMGYAGSQLALELTLRPGWNYVFYSALLVLRFAPVAALVWHFLPAPLGAQAAYAQRLMAKMRGVAAWRFRLSGQGAAPWVAFGLVFVLVYGEFELAAMWSLKTWTVLVFDAQAGGLPLADTLRLVAVPATLELALLAVLLGALGNGPASAAGEPGAAQRPGAVAAGAWLYLGGAALVTALGPLGFVGAQSIRGFAALRGNEVLLKDVAASVFFAGVGAMLAYGLAAGLSALGVGLKPGFASMKSVAALKSGRAVPALVMHNCGGTPQPLLKASLVLHVALNLTAVGCWLGRLAGRMLTGVGLLGGLVIGLLLLAAFQWPVVHGLYDTPVPLVSALAVLLLPLAMFLRAVLLRAAPGLHVARLLGQRRLIWELDTRRRAWVFLLLFCWAYFEFGAASILAPVGMTPVFVRLQNLAHYGQTAVLSAMFSAAALVPAAVVLLTVGFYARVRGH